MKMKFLAVAALGFVSTALVASESFATAPIRCYCKWDEKYKSCSVITNSQGKQEVVLDKTGAKNNVVRNTDLADCKKLRDELAAETSTNPAALCQNQKMYVNVDCDSAKFPYHPPLGPTPPESVEPAGSANGEDLLTNFLTSI